MNAKELMIGDWVLDGGIKAQVTSITCDGNIETTKRMSNEEIVEPIPLTQEILKKNEFIYDDNWHISRIEVCNYRIAVSFGYGGEVDYMEIIEQGKDKVIPSERTKLYLTHIKYVHELQHALGLCEIEKEIEL